MHPTHSPLKGSACSQMGMAHFTPLTTGQPVCRLATSKVLWHVGSGKHQCLRLLSYPLVYQRALGNSGVHALPS